MGMIRSAPQALLFQAAAVNDPELFEPLNAILQRRYGTLLSMHGPYRFDEFSAYYRQEMGEKLWKTFYFFRAPVSLEHIYRYKLESQSLESSYSRNGKRSLNLDPGYLTLYQFALLTTKAFSHRTYLADGIYTECTLIAKGSGFSALPWTYPDYGTTEAMEFFKEAKKYLKNKLGADGGSGEDERLNKRSIISSKNPERRRRVEHQ